MDCSFSSYFNEVLIEVNLLFRVVPRPLTATMIAIEMPAAIRPYSMAVAPLSSARNFANICFTMISVLNQNDFGIISLPRRQ
jgi:hypothetical protein